MQKYPASMLMQDILTTLKSDLNSAGTDLLFACRPLKGSTFEKDTVLGRFRGEVGLAGVNEFKAALDDLVTEKLVKVVLDLAEVSLSRTAIGALVTFAATMHGRNKRLYLYRVSDQVRTSLHQLGLTGFFSYLETEEDILTTLVI